QADVDLHCVLLEPKDPVRLSRYGRKIDLAGTLDTDPALIDFLVDYARKLGHRPVVFATSDALALQLASNAARLDPVARIPSISYDALLNIIGKEGLYRSARAAGVPTIPYIVAEDSDEIAEWSRAHPGPYLVKPFYEGFSG